MTVAVLLGQLQNIADLDDNNNDTNITSSLARIFCQVHMSRHMLRAAHTGSMATGKQIKAHTQMKIQTKTQTKTQSSSSSSSSRSREQTLMPGRKHDSTRTPSFSSNQKTNANETLARQNEVNFQIFSPFPLLFLLIFLIFLLMVYFS